jgi:DNA-binding transcriptional LysR family regulator
MSELSDYRSFVAVVECGSLTAAARQLGRSLQAVSRSLQMLEQELGVELVARTTRRSRPTEAGRKFYQRLRTALADLDLARETVALEGVGAVGRIRIAASSRFGVTYVLPVLAAFMERHPAIEIELSLEDRYVDLQAENFDLSIQFGHPADSSLRMRRLGLIRRVVFAAPRYLAARGRPQKPEDLKHHDCVLRISHHSHESWQFGAGDSLQQVPVKGRFRSDTAPARIEAVVAGLGIGQAPLYQIRPYLDDGRIELLLPDYESAPIPAQMIWLPGVMPARLRLLIDFIAARLSLAGL